MYKIPNFKRSSVRENNSTEGEPIEIKIERAIENKEKLEGDAPLIFTEKSDGVNAGYNIRTDRFEIALDGIDKMQKSYRARREETAKIVPINKENEGNNTDNIQGT